MPTMEYAAEASVGTGYIPETISQIRPKDERYCLQVDRQTKASFSTMDAAEQVGRAIKKENPVVRVTIYDAKDYTTKVIE